MEQLAKPNVPIPADNVDALFEQYADTVYRLAFLRTKSGLLLRATGDNAGFVTMLARDPGRSKIIGLALGNGFAALAGSVIAQAKGSADQQMGVGMVVAFAVAYASIAWLLKFVATNTLRSFVIYRVVFGLAIVGALVAGALTAT